MNRTSAPGLVLAGMVIAASLPPSTAAQSFDCRKATTDVEKTICADKTLLGGMGVTFEGEYGKGEALLPPPPFSEVGILAKGVPESAFKALVGKDFTTAESEERHRGARAIGGVHPPGSEWAAASVPKRRRSSGRRTLKKREPHYGTKRAGGIVVTRDRRAGRARVLG